MVFGGGTNGVVVFSSGGPVVPGAAVVTGPAVVPGFPAVVVSTSRRPSGLRKTTITLNSLAHRTTWLRSDLVQWFLVVAQMVL